jgi:hypothetical protein
MSVPPESAATPPPVPPEPPPDIPPGAPSVEERQWAVFAHLAALAGFVFPFGNVVGPLIVWLIKKDTLPFADQQGKEALNFNITVAIAAVVCTILIFVLIGGLLLIVLAVLWLVFLVVAAVQANNGVAYRYPFTLRLIK